MRFHYHFLWLALLMGCDLYIGDDAPESVDGTIAQPPTEPPDMPCLDCDAGVGCDAGVEQDAPPNDPPEPPTGCIALPDGGCAPIEPVTDAGIDAELATHPPLPIPQACIPYCLDAGL